MRVSFVCQRQISNNRAYRQTWTGLGCSRHSRVSTWAYAEHAVSEGAAVVHAGVQDKARQAAQDSVCNHVTPAGRRKKESTCFSSFLRNKRIGKTQKIFTAVFS